MTYNYKKPSQVIHGEVIGKGILRVVESHGHPLIQQYANIHNMIKVLIILDSRDNILPRKYLLQKCKLASLLQFNRFMQTHTYTVIHKKIQIKNVNIKYFNTHKECKLQLLFLYSALVEDLATAVYF